jgi:hypothetical protein
MFFIKGGAVQGTFGNNEYLRSTSNNRNKESYTVSAASVPLEDVGDGTGLTQKVLAKGEVMAKITSGAEIGKVGPFQGGTVANEVQTVGLGAATAGTVAITFDGETTGAIAFNATAAAVQVALNAMSNVSDGDIVASGGPFPGIVTLTFGGKYAGVNVAEVTVAPTGLTGGAVTVATTTQGGQAGGVTDGRGDRANIVGLNDTFLPWQLIEGDREIAVNYDCYANQGWCTERNASGVRVPLTNAVADTMRGRKDLDVKFK